MLSFTLCARLLGLLCADGQHPPVPVLCTSVFMVAPLKRLDHNAVILFQRGDLCLSRALCPLVKRHGLNVSPGTQPQRAEQSGVWALGESGLTCPAPRGKRMLPLGLIPGQGIVTLLFCLAKS